MDYSLNGQYYKGDWVLIGYNLLAVLKRCIHLYNILI